MPFGKQGKSEGIHGGKFYGPVQVGGSQVNIHRRSMRRTVVASGVAAAVAAVLLGSAWIGYHAYTASDSYRLRAEEGLISRLTPGQGYYRVNEALGVEPSFSVKLSSGNKLHQYEREWETLQFIESPSGATLSSAIYAKSLSFRPNISLGGRDVRLNVTALAETIPLYKPTAVNAYCGAHKGGYIEAYYPMPNAFRAQNIAVGASSAETEEISLSASCEALAMSGCQVPQPKYDNEVSEALAGCLEKSPEIREMRRTLKVSVVVVTAPGEQLVPDMLYPPDVVAAGTINGR